MIKQIIYKNTILNIFLLALFFINNYYYWRSLGYGWNNIYKHFIKLVEWKIIDTSFIDLLESYTNKRNGKHLKVIMVDTSNIHNKNGNDYLKCNYCVKYKCCAKMLTIVDISYMSICI